MKHEMKKQPFNVKNWLLGRPHACSRDACVPNKRKNRKNRYKYLL